MDQLGTIITGLSALLIAVGGLLTQRSKAIRVTDRQSVRDNKRLARQFQTSLRHALRLEMLLTQAGIDVPERPAPMDPEWGIEDDEPQRQQEAGRS